MATAILKGPGMPEESAYEWNQLEAHPGVIRIPSREVPPKRQTCRFWPQRRWCFGCFGAPICTAACARCRVCNQWWDDWYVGGTNGYQPGAEKRGWMNLVLENKLVPIIFLQPSCFWLFSFSVLIFELIIFILSRVLIVHSFSTSSMQFRQGMSSKNWRYQPTSLRWKNVKMLAGRQCFLYAIRTQKSIFNFRLGTITRVSWKLVLVSSTSHPPLVEKFAWFVSLQDGMINFEEFLPLVSKNSSWDTNHTLHHLGHPKLLNFVFGGPLVHWWCRILSSNSGS